MSDRSHLQDTENKSDKKWKLIQYMNLLRLKHYIKNVLIFVPLFFSGQMFDRGRIVSTIQGMIIFCIGCSCVYIINDIKDVEKDRLHPVKCKRPIASGAITKKSACILCFVLIIFDYSMLYFTKFNWKIGVLLTLYIVINLGYSFGLKNVPILDVALLSFGFLLRVIYGGIVSDTIVSSWLYLTVIALSFYLGLGKRRNELRKIKSAETRKVMEQYSEDFLDRNMYMCLALGLVFYSLWTVERARNFMWSIPLVLIICMKYNLILEKESEGDPVVTLLASKSLIALVGIYVILAICLLYI